MLMSDESPRTIPDVLLGRAARIGTASLHEAGGRHGALPETLRPLHPSFHAAGRAFPVRSPVGDNLWIHHAIAAAQPGDMLVVDAGGGADFGYWGEIMASAALARGLAGLVITGGVRDSLRLVELGLPTFTTGTAIRGTIKALHGDGSLGAPVRIGEVIVRRGDLIVGDADGVVCFPADRAGDVVEAAEGRDAAEKDILRRIAAGETTLEIYKLASPLGLTSPHGASPIVKTQREEG
jgi:4-hydroxy-4-methyl-2-oxoglutarate aldolase